MRLTPPAALVAVSLVVTGCGVLSSATCDFAADDQIESILGETELETFNVERLDECTFTSVNDPSQQVVVRVETCLLYTSPSPRDRQKSRMPSSA